MNKLKFLFLILVIILFTGCTVKYNLIIDDDLSVTETVEAIEQESVVKTNTGMKGDKAVKYIYNIFKRDEVDMNLSSKSDGRNISGTASAGYNSLDEYVSSFTSDIFEKANLSKSNNIYSLSFKQSEKLSTKSSNAPMYDKVELSITLPYKVISHNADKVYKDTYTWYLEKDQELRTIKIKFDTSNKKGSFNFFNFNIKYSYIALAIFIVIIISMIAIVYINNKKNNRF